jgi:hypothetical protein
MVDSFAAPTQLFFFCGLVFLHLITLHFRVIHYMELLVAVIGLMSRSYIGSGYILLKRIRNLYFLFFLTKQAERKTMPVSDFPLD